VPALAFGMQPGYNKGCGPPRGLGRSHRAAGLRRIAPRDCRAERGETTLPGETVRQPVEKGGAHAR